MLPTRHITLLTLFFPAAVSAVHLKFLVRTSQYWQFVNLNRTLVIQPSGATPCSHVPSTVTLYTWYIHFKYANNIGIQTEYLNS